MAQFYAEEGLYRQLYRHPSRVSNPEQAAIVYVPLLAKLSSDAARCNGTSHRERMQAVFTALRSSVRWQQNNGTDHVWACACIMMKGLIGADLWRLLGTATHAVHSIPRGKASPSACQLGVPYLNPTFAHVPAYVREPGRERPTLAHFRGRVMNRVRGDLIRAYRKAPNVIIRKAHPATAARCNVNKCSPAQMDRAGFSPSGHFNEMTNATFCIVPIGDSPPSSRLYLALAAGCIPVFLSDAFYVRTDPVSPPHSCEATTPWLSTPPFLPQGAFPAAVPWSSFSLRFPEREVVNNKSFDLIGQLAAVAADSARHTPALPAHASTPFPTPPPLPSVSLHYYPSSARACASSLPPPPPPMGAHTWRHTCRVYLGSTLKATPHEPPRMHQDPHDAAGDARPRG